MRDVYGSGESVLLVYVLFFFYIVNELVIFI